MAIHTSRRLPVFQSRKNTRLRRACRAVMRALIAGCLVMPQFAMAQNVNLPTTQSGGDGDIVSSVLRNFQQRLSGPTQVPSLQPNVTVENGPFYSQQLQYDAAGNPILPQMRFDSRRMSTLERTMSERAGQQVRQFGYQSFGQGLPVVARQTGALQDSYLLGVGDEIVLTLRGHENASYRTEVDRDGRVVFPALAPVAAAGRSFGTFRADLEAAVTRALPGTEALVSVGQIRQISVRVVGEVEHPGVYALTGLSTAVDALDLAGGIRKTGSLRDIEIVRGERTIKLDLYNLLAGSGAGSSIVLTDGDRIVVPLETRSVAVVGSVKRPAIYELPPRDQPCRLSDLLALAGGPETAGDYRFSILQTAQDGHRELVQVSATSAEIVQDGDVIFVSPSVDVSDAKVELMGSSRLAGVYPLGSARSLRGLLKSTDMFAPTLGKPLPYLLIAAVIRLDPVTLQRNVLPFSPVDVLAGKTDMPLQSNDIVYILSVSEMNYITRRAVSTEQQPPQYLIDDHGGQARTPDADRLLASAVAGTPEPGTLLPSQYALPAQENPQNAQIPPAQSGQPLAYQSGHAEPSAGLSYEQTRPSADSEPNEPETEAERVNPGIPAPLRADDMGDPDRAEDDDRNLSRQRLFAGEGEMDARADNTAGDMSGERTQSRNIRQPRQRLFVGIDDDARRLLVSVLSGYAVSVAGEVNTPGSFLAVPGTGLDKIVEAAGGLTPKADLHAIDISELDIDNASGVSRTERKVLDMPKAQFAGQSVMPFDRIRFNPVFSDRDSGDVAVYGQVRFPGTYEILRGERLSSVLARAGGLTASAYAPGAIFLRRSVAAQERGVMRREADLLEGQIVALAGNAALTPNGQTPQAEIAYVSQLVQRLRQGADQNGRIAIHIEPKEVAVHPELDVVMEPGDQLFIPREPSSVVVSGEVMAPGGIQYSAHRTVSDYIAMAGGPTEIADEGHIFVVFPDGSAQQVDRGWLPDFDAAELVPGSVIIVPRSLRNFTWDTLLENVIQTTSQLAITAASISVIFK